MIVQPLQDHYFSCFQGSGMSSGPLEPFRYQRGLLELIDQTVLVRSWKKAPVRQSLITK